MTAHHFVTAILCLAALAGTAAAQCQRPQDFSHPLAPVRGKLFWVLDGKAEPLLNASLRLRNRECKTNAPECRPGMGEVVAVFNASIHGDINLTGLPQGDYVLEMVGGPQSWSAPVTISGQGQEDTVDLGLGYQGGCTFLETRKGDG